MTPDPASKAERLKAKRDVAWRRRAGAESAVRSAEKRLFRAKGRFARANNAWITAYHAWMNERLAIKQEPGP